MCRKHVKIVWSHRDEVFWKSVLAIFISQTIYFNRVYDKFLYMHYYYDDDEIDKWVT